MTSSKFWLFECSGSPANLKNTITAFPRNFIGSLQSIA